MRTLDGRNVEILSTAKVGMSIFKVYGLLDGRPCHWTDGGKYRMDGKADPRDLTGRPE